MTTDYTNEMNLFGGFEPTTQAEAKKTGGDAKYPAMTLLKVKQAVANRSESGVVTLNIMVTPCDSETKEELGKSFELDTFFITGRDSVQTQWNKSAQKKIDNLRYLTNPQMPDGTPWQTKILPARAWDKEIKAFVEDKPLPQLAEIVGKLFYGVVVCKHEYPRIVVNGYSRAPITPYGVDPTANATEKANIESIYVPDHTGELQPRFSLWGMYDVNTKQSLAERIDGKEPENWITTLELVKEKASNGEFREAELEVSKEQSSRKKQLQNKLGASFDEDRWSALNGAVISAVSETVSYF